MKPTFPFLPRAGRRLATLLTLGAALGLAACGGSTSRVDEFDPDRMVVFGDELSVLGSGASSTEPVGAKYGINQVVASTGALACASAPLWVQSLASGFGLTFAECGGSAGSATAVMQAAYGARVSDVAAQFTRFDAGDDLDARTLVTVLAGMHDVLDAYEAFDAGRLTRDQALAQVGAAGVALGDLINRMTDGGRGGRVVYVTMPDLSLSPFALAEKAAHSDVDRAALLKDLVARFNEKLRNQVINDGRHAGLVTGDELLQVMAKYPSSYSLASVDTAACQLTVAQFDGSEDGDQAGVHSAAFVGYITAGDDRRVMGCSTLTLVSGTAGSASTYLWADALRPAAAWQAQLGSRALSRARTNPF